jgi:hypothetical protein
LPSNIDITLSSYRIQRLTALWALSEGFLGGILHAFKIPFTGLFIGNTAAIIITLIALFSVKKGEILKATLIVIIAKGIISPHTPFTAYLAVLIQGLAGAAFFSFKKIPAISVFGLAMFASVYSACQKVLLLTLIFGKNLWESIDVFFNFILKEVFGAVGSKVELSFWLILIYFLIHIIGGFVAGFIGWRLYRKLPSKLESSLKEGILLTRFDSGNTDMSKKKKKKHWWARPTGILLFSFFALLLILSYVYNGSGLFESNSIIVMIIRSVLIMLIWFNFLSKVLIILFHKYLKKKENTYSAELAEIVDLLPRFKAIVAHSWRKSSDRKSVV